MSSAVLKHPVPRGKRSAMGFLARLELRRVCQVLPVFILPIGVACGPGAGLGAPAPGPDTRVPDSVARETLELVVDLERSANCEEDFDLALYEERGVDLIEWDVAARPCVERRVRVRFLPRRVSRQAVLDRIEELTTSVRDGAGAGERSSGKKP